MCSIMPPAVPGDFDFRRDHTFGRRSLLAGGVVAVTLARGGADATAKEKEKEKEKEDDQGVGPGEDLMREHGVLRRVLLVYREMIRRLEAGGATDSFDPELLQRSTKLIRRFVEDYHERQEEELIFPRFEKANKLTELVRVLRAQHNAGRKVTDRTIALANAAALKDSARRASLRGELAAFVRMYEVHAAREDTVLFPALHDIMHHREYDALGEDMERREHKVFGGEGFEPAVAEVDSIEKALGIEDLAKFTPAT
jgi:hemerythrin-like domain-containing protein